MPKEFEIGIIKQNCPNHKKIHYRIDVEYADVEKFEEWMGMDKLYIQDAMDEGKNYPLSCTHIKGTKQ
jgi:hypothetical protein